MVEEPDELSASDSEGVASPSRKPLRIGTRAGMARMWREEEMPPSPTKPEIDLRMPWERDGETGGRSVKGERELRREVLVALEGVCDK
jgi:hypothetical protein